jgi:hypothetical protein
VILALLVAIAAQGVHAKLIIVMPNQPPLAIDYPSMERCERAKAELRSQTYDPKTGQTEHKPDGSMVIHTGNPIRGYCIPS